MIYSSTMKTVFRNPKYEISPDGVVQHKVNKCPLKQSLTKIGYLQVCLSNTNAVTIHRLLAEAFLPNPNNLEDVNHKNGNKTDNRIENLEWVSTSENERHKRDILKTSRNFGKPLVLNRDLVKQIKNARKMKYSRLEIFALFPTISRHLIDSVLYKQSWKDVV